VYFTDRAAGVFTLEREKRKDGPEVDHHELKIDPISGTGSAVISVHRGVDKPTGATACCPPSSTTSPKREQPRPDPNSFPTCPPNRLDRDIDQQRENIHDTTPDGPPESQHQSDSRRAAVLLRSHAEQDVSNR
jgi:hypothetical protein